jgi:hypothetical protein
MHGWLGPLIALAALLVIAPLAAWLGLRHGRRVRGSAGLALMMLGFGAIFDPPKRHAMEAMDVEEKDREGAGEPPLDHRR